MHDAAVGEDGGRGEVAGAVTGEERDDAADLLGSAIRPIGMAASSRFIAAGSASVAALIGVSTAPGPTPTTRTPWGASSTPAVRVSMRIPPLDRQYAVLPGIGQSSWTEVMLMMRPPSPWAIICLAAIWVPKKALLRLMSRTLLVLLLGRVEHRGAGLDAGVVDHDVEPAERLDGRVDEPLQVGDLADVGLDADGLVAEGVAPSLELFGRLGVGDVVDDDVGALVRRGRGRWPCRSRCCLR